MVPAADGSEHVAARVAEVDATAVLRVVVVDDEPDIRLMLRLQLDAVPGMAVVGEAVDGAEALDVVAATAPDAVVVDLLMPRTSGFDAITRLRAEQPAVGIVAHSAVAGGFVRSEMERLGIDLVLKSGDVGPLTAALRRAVGRADEAP